MEEARRRARAGYKDLFEFTPVMIVVAGGRRRPERIIDCNRLFVAAHLTQQLLAFGRRQILRPTRVGLHKELDKVRVTSQVVKGSTFTIFLPLASLEDAATVTSESELANRPWVCFLRYPESLTVR